MHTLLTSSAGSDPSSLEPAGVAPPSLSPRTAVQNSLAPLGLLPLEWWGPTLHHLAAFSVGLMSHLTAQNALRFLGFSVLLTGAPVGCIGAGLHMLLSSLSTASRWLTLLKGGVTSTGAASSAVISSALLPLVVRDSVLSLSGCHRTGRRLTGCLLQKLEMSWIALSVGGTINVLTIAPLFTYNVPSEHQPSNRGFVKSMKQGCGRRPHSSMLLLARLPSTTSWMLATGRLFVI